MDMAAFCTPKIGQPPTTCPSTLVSRVAEVQDLIRHLRANPADRDVLALAEKFGVQSRIVQIAIDSMPRAPKHRAPDSGRTWIKIRDVFKALWIKATHRLLLFLVVTNLVYVLSFVLMDSAPVSWGAGLGIDTAVLKVVFFIGAFLAFPLIQLAAIARTAQYRNVVMGALLYGSTLGIGLVGLSGKTGETSVKLSGQPVTIGWVLGVTVISFTSLYLFAGIPAVVGASYWRMRSQKKVNANLTRQQMLQRLIEIRQTLAQAGESQDTPQSSPTHFNWLEKWAFPVAFVLGLVTTTLYHTAMKAADPSGSLASMKGQGALPTNLNPVALLCSILANLGQIAAQFGLGLLATRLRKAMAIAAAFVTANIVVHLSPLSYLSISQIAKIGWLPFFVGTWSQFVLVSLGCLARQVYDYSKSIARRQTNDPDALMEELLDLEWRLVPKSAQITVLAIDVVGSTAMKNGADPILTEWSFREYQTWVEATCASFSGKVESTAGDGAIVGFLDPNLAVQAAVALQEGIANFNSTVNKMSEPFRIRIGLHTGEVQGELGDVQFTRVIDVAAHIESRAPVGGIAASETIVSALNGLNFERMETSIDGHEVFTMSVP